MKNIIIFLLFPLFVFSQNYDADTTKAIKYFIKRDTATNGIITMQYFPADSIQKEFNLKLEAIAADSTSLTNLRNELTIKLQELSRQRKQIIARKRQFSALK